MPPEHLPTAAERLALRCLADDLRAAAAACQSAQREAFDRFVASRVAQHETAAVDPDRVGYCRCSHGPLECPVCNTVLYA